MFEIKNDERRYFSGKIDEKGRLRCPMCRGRGYFEPTEQAEDDLDEYSSLERLKGKESNHKLPALRTKACVREPSKQQKKISLPSIVKPKHFAGRKSTDEVNQCKSNSRFIVNCEYSKMEINAVAKDGLSKPITANSNESEFDNQLLPSPKTPKNSHDFLKSSLVKLKGTDWNEALSALKEIIQISRYQPDLLEGSMVVVHRGVTSLLKTFRSKIIRTACQAINELFSNVPNTQRPEFDELISALLQRTADTNKFVRRDANEALDSMVINVLPIHSVRTLVQKGIPHRNAAIRATAVRLLVCVVGLVGVGNIYAGNKETRSRIMNAAALSLQDGCQEVRSYGCRLIKMLMENEDFEEVLQGCVSNVLLNRIEKTLITIKYHK